VFPLLSPLYAIAGRITCPDFYRRMWIQASATVMALLFEWHADSVIAAIGTKNGMVN
jgi:hypothetical protein